MDNLPEIGLKAIIDNLKNFKDSANSISESYLTMAQNAEITEKGSFSMSAALTGVATILSTVVVAAAAAAVAAIAGVSVALVALGKEGVEAFVKFEQQMNEVFTLTPGISQDAMDDMTQQVKDFAKEFGVLPEKVVPALYQAISAGVPPENVFDFLATAQKAASGGVTELETSVKGIVSVINAYGTDVLSATEASDLMFKAVAQGITTYDELSASLFNVIPTAASLGVQFGDVTAAIATMTSQGTPTSVATTQLRQLLVELSSAGSDVSDVFIKITGKTFQDFITEGGNLQDALNVLSGGYTEVSSDAAAYDKAMIKNTEKLDKLKDQLEVATIKQGEFTEKTSESSRVANQNKIDTLRYEISKLEEEMSSATVTTDTTHTTMKDLFGSVEAGSAALQLTGSGAEKFTTSLDEMENSAGATDAAFNRMEQGSGRAIEKLKAGWAVFLLDIGDTLGPSLNSAVDLFRKLLDKISPLFIEIYKIVAPIIENIFGTASKLVDSFFKSFEVGKSLGLSTLQSIFVGISNALRTTFGLMSDNPIFPFISSIKNLIATVMGTSSEFLTFDSIFQFLKDTIINIANTVLPMLTNAINFVADNWPNFIAAIDNAVNWIKNELIPAVKEWYTWFKDNIWPVILDVADVIKNDVIPAISDFASWITDELVPALKDIYEWIDDNVVPIFEDLFKLFSKDGKKAGGIMSDIWEDISKRLEPFIEEILPELIKIWDEILAWTKRNWPKIQTIIIVTMLAIEKKIDAVLSWIKQFWEKWGDTILDVTEATFGFIWRSIKRALDLIMNIIELALNVITGDWKGAWQNILNITTTVNNQIKDLISTTWNNIKSIIATALQQVISDVGTKLAQLKSSIDAKFNEIKNSISNIWNSIKTAVVNAINSMMQGIINAITAYASRISTTLSTVISNAVSSLLSNITSGGIYTTLIAIGTKIINVITTAFNTVGDIAEKLRTAISNGIQTLIANFGTLSTKLAELATNIMNRIGANIALAYNTIRTNVADAIQTAVEGIWTGAGALLTSIYNVGKRIIDSIVSGIKSNYYSVKEALKKIVKDLVEDALDFLGFGSPSKIFMGMGEGISASLALGITKGIPVIESALRGMSVAPLMSAPISSGSAASQAISNQTFNLGGNTIANSMDAATFEARVMDVIRRNV